MQTKRFPFWQKLFWAIGLLLLMAIIGGFGAALMADGTADDYARGWTKGFGVGLGVAFGLALASRVMGLSRAPPGQDETTRPADSPAPDTPRRQEQ